MLNIIIKHFFIYVCCYLYLSCHTNLLTLHEKIAKKTLFYYCSTLF